MNKMNGIVFQAYDESTPAQAHNLWSDYPKHPDPNDDTLLEVTATQKDGIANIIVTRKFDTGKDKNYVIKRVR